MSEQHVAARPRWVGLDYGAKRVGIAISDPLRLFAQPLGTFTPGEALSRLGHLAEDEGVEVVVVGWPLLPDGGEGEATQAVATFIQRMKRVLQGAVIVRWDERYTSVVAAEKIRDAGPKRRWKRTKGRVDAAAAAVILQEYLDDVSAREGAGGEEEDA